MSHRCDEKDPRRDTGSWIHPENLPDEPFYLIPVMCDCNYEVRYDVVTVEDYMKDRLAYYQRAMQREAQAARHRMQEAQNADAAAAEQPRNEGNNAAAAAAEQPRNEGNNAAAAAEQPQNPVIDRIAAARLRDERRMRIGVERLLNDRMFGAAERRRQQEIDARAAELRAEHPQNVEVLPNPEAIPRPAGIVAAVLRARLNNMDGIYDEQMLAAELHDNPAIRNPGQAAQRPIPGLEPLSSPAISQHGFEVER